MINIANINKAEALAALYNASKQQGMGFLHSRGREPLTTEQAAALIEDGGLHFDYLHGRVMKVSLDEDLLDPRLYDRDNGEGAAERALAHLITPAA